MRLRIKGNCAMNGERYLLDTNAVIQLFGGNRAVVQVLNMADFVAMSVVTEFEFLSYPALTEADRREYQEFRACLHVYDVPSDDNILTQMIVSARRRHGLKLPDAIIASTARKNDLTLLTADDHFKKLKSPWKVRFYKPI